jgi:transcriptional regulator with XRE-family HTH domain
MTDADTPLADPRFAPTDPTHAIGLRIKLERAKRSWSLADLAERSGVSKAMISKIERGEASPTATVLGRLSGALGLALSMLLALAEQATDRLSRRQDQTVWQDPETGYTRRLVSPSGGGVLELLEVELPAQVRVPYPASAFTFQHEQIMVTHNTLLFIEGRVEHRLEAGDCLQLGPPEDCVFVNPGRQPCRYLVALVRR